MFSRILLDNDDFFVTAGLFGGIKVTLKSRGLTLKATREERVKLLDVLDELKLRGYSVDPNSKEFEETLDGFSEALLGRGGIRWQAYFLVTTCENIVNEVVGKLDSSNLENPKDSRPSWMKKADQWEKSLTQEKWQESLNLQMAKEQDRYHQK